MSTSFDDSKWVWMNGRAIPWQRRHHTMCRRTRCTTASGVFEGIRCYETTDGAALFRLDAHLDRLYASAESYGLTIPTLVKS